MNRQEYWLSKGYTKKQIENHLEFERYKGKLTRERKKKNNEANKELIKQIKNDLIGTDLNLNGVNIKIMTIRESVDGAGFWFKFKKIFRDGSCGEFRDFSYFEEYDFKQFIENISY